jgi:hypothetical protein
MLGDREGSVELLVGVDKADGGLESHAWVEAGGRVYGDQPEALRRFVPLLRLTSP